MERKRVAGRFVKSSPEEPVGNAPATRIGLRGIKHCQTFTRKEFAAALPNVVAVFVEKAQAGSVAHLRMLLQLTGMDKEEVPIKGKPKGKSLVEYFTEQYENDKAERAAAEQAAADQAAAGDLPESLFPLPDEFDA